MYQQSRSAYQNAQVDGGTQAGLLQLVYTHLAKDFLKAAEAVRQNNVAARCAASNHALLLLGHLESWIQSVEEPGLADSLRAFYGMLRTSLLQLQATLNADRFEECAQMVLDSGAAWQAKEESVLVAASRTVSAACPETGGISFHV